MIRFKDLWYNNEATTLLDFEIATINQDEETGLYIIENTDGLMFACTEYEKIDLDTYMEED